VLSVFIVIAGLAAMRTLPIAQYPEIVAHHERGFALVASDHGYTVLQRYRFHGG
jgi:hypothetical protein